MDIGVKYSLYSVLIIIFFISMAFAANSNFVECGNNVCDMVNTGSITIFLGDTESVQISGKIINIKLKKVTGKSNAEIEITDGASTANGEIIQQQETNIGGLKIFTEDVSMINSFGRSYVVIKVIGEDRSTCSQDCIAGQSIVCGDGIPESVNINTVLSVGSSIKFATGTNREHELRLNGVGSTTYGDTAFVVLDSKPQFELYEGDNNVEHEGLYFTVPRYGVEKDNQRLTVQITGETEANCQQDFNPQICTDDGDCPSGQVCDAGTCKAVQSCQIDSDCASGQVCDNGQCKTNVAAPSCVITGPETVAAEEGFTLCVDTQKGGPVTRFISNWTGHRVYYYDTDAGIEKEFPDIELTNYTGCWAVRKHINDAPSTVTITAIGPGGTSTCEHTVSLTGGDTPQCIISGPETVSPDQGFRLCWDATIGGDITQVTSRWTGTRVHYYETSGDASVTEYDLPDSNGLGASSCWDPIYKHPGEGPSTVTITATGPGGTGTCEHIVSLESSGSCSRNSDCPLGKICDNNECIDGCSRNDDCPSGQRCINNVCKESCSSDDECTGNEKCIGNRCQIPECISNSDCQSGMHCINYECKIKNNNAQFVSQDVPLIMSAGQLYNISIIFKNNGDTTWTNPSYSLGSQNPQDNTYWGFSRVPFAQLETVSSGSEKIFNFTVTAPSAKGRKNFQWQMVHSGNFFGDKTTNVVVDITCEDVNNNDVCDFQETCEGNVSVNTCSEGEYCAWVVGKGFTLVSGKDYDCTCLEGKDYALGPFEEVRRFGFESKDELFPIDDVAGSKGFSRIYTKISYSGQSSYELDKRNTDGFTRIVIPVTLEPGTYTVQVMTKSNMPLAAYIGADTALSLPNGGTDWEQLSVTFDTSGDSTIFLTVTAYARVFFDDLVIIKHDYICDIFCVDGTANGFCASDAVSGPPFFCSNGELEERPLVCGCPDGAPLADDNTCGTCGDGTIPRACSLITPGKYCTGNLELIDGAKEPYNCECASGFVADFNGVCRSSCDNDGICMPWEINSCNDCPKRIKSVKAEKTETGVHFSADIDVVLPTFVACKANSTVNECLASYDHATGTCGDSCLCGSNLNTNCDLKCGDTTDTYYIAVKGRVDLKKVFVVSESGSYECPSLNIETLEEIKNDFKDISDFAELTIQETEFLLQKNISELKQQSLEKQKDVYTEISLLAKSHIAYIDSAMIDLTETKSKEVIDTTVRVRKRINNLLKGLTKPTDITLLNINFKKDVRIDTLQEITAKIKNKGDDPRYIVLDCTLTDPNGDVTVLESQCTEIKTTQMVNTSSFIATLGDWAINKCSIQFSLLPECRLLSTYATIPKDTGNVGMFNAFTSEGINITKAEVQESIIVGTSAKVDITAESLDIVNLYVGATCVFAGPETKNASSDCTLLQPGTSILLPVKTLINTTGSWKVASCDIVTAIDNKCEFVTDQINLTDIGDFSAASGKLLKITTHSTPSADVELGSDATVIVYVKNIAQNEQSAFVECIFVDPHKNKIITGTEPRTIQSGKEVAFTPKLTANAGGDWEVESCSVSTSLPRVQQDEKVITETFRVPLSSAQCEQNIDCAGTTQSCGCVQNTCQGCPTGYTCDSYQCEPIITDGQCIDSTQCDIDEVCNNGECITVSFLGCTDDMDCDIGEVCVNNECVITEDTAEGIPIFIPLIIIIIIGLAGFLIYRRQTSEEL